MAKHFKDSVDKTTVAPRRMVPSPTQSKQQGQPINRTRRARRPQRSRDEVDIELQYGNAAPRAYASEMSAGTSFYFDDEVIQTRGGIWKLFRGIFLLLAWIVRLVAIVLFVLVMLKSVQIPYVYHAVTYVLDYGTQYLPWREFGALSLDTPLGGVFRCDLCIASLLLFVVDWILCRIRAAMV